VLRNLSETSKVACAAAPTVMEYMNTVLVSKPNRIPMLENAASNPKLIMHDIKTARVRLYGENGCFGCAMKQERMMCSFFRKIWSREEESKKVNIEYLTHGQ
jgi:hypothetical protein